MISENLKDILEKKKMKKEQLAELADLPMETVRNLYYGRTTDPKVSTMLAISKVLNVSVNRLMGQQMYSTAEEKLIRNYRRCGAHGRSMIMLTANYEADLSRHERDAENKHIIPCIVPIDAVKDGLQYSSSNMVDIATDNPEAYIAIEITSNEFTPIYCKGDRVLIADRFPASGETGVFIIDCMVYCRIFEEHDDGYLLKSLNRHGQDFKLKRLDKVKHIGTCVGIIRS